MTQKTPLIFDFGNVIAFFNYAKATATLGQRLGISGDELLLRLQQRGFNSLVVRYESGRIDDFQFHREFNDLAELDMTYDEFVPAWSDIFHLNESVNLNTNRMCTLQDAAERTAGALPDLNPNSTVALT